MDIGTILVSTGAGGILGTLIKTLFNRRKLSADTASVLTKAASGLVQDLEKQIDRLSRKVDDLEEQVSSLGTQVRTLTSELDSAHDLLRDKDNLIAEMLRTEREHNTRSTDR